MKSQTKIGKVVEPKGLKGDLKIHLFSGVAPWLSEIKEIRIGSKTYGLVSGKIVKGQLILKVSEVFDRTAAEKLVGQEVAISDDLLMSRPGRFYLPERGSRFSSC